LVARCSGGCSRSRRSLFERGDVAGDLGALALAPGRRPHAAGQVALAKRIGTFDISIRPHQDCCTLFVPAHPETKGNPSRAAKLESRLDLEPLLAEAVDRAEAIEV
jgi:thiamine biosynthesis protein ThiI